ncbi:MAG: hypothetical protein ACE5GL_07115 [Calditrichia bacterium]
MFKNREADVSRMTILETYFMLPASKAACGTIPQSPYSAFGVPPE